MTLKMRFTHKMNLSQAKAGLVFAARKQGPPRHPDPKYFTLFSTILANVLWICANAAVLLPNHHSVLRLLTGLASAALTAL